MNFVCCTYYEWTQGLDMRLKEMMMTMMIHAHFLAGHNKAFFLHSTLFRCYLHIFNFEARSKGVMKSLISWHQLLQMFDREQSKSSNTQSCTYQHYLLNPRYVLILVKYIQVIGNWVCKTKLVCQSKIQSEQNGPL